MLSGDSVCNCPSASLQANDLSNSVRTGNLHRYLVVAGEHAKKNEAIRRKERLYAMLHQTFL